MATNNHLPPPSSSPSHPQNPNSLNGNADHDRPTASRRAVLERRSRRAKQLIRFLKDSHWALLEDLRVRLSRYYWHYGASPLLRDHRRASSEEETVVDVSVRSCAFPGCKHKAMELTSYCYSHILSDPKQTLYRSCTHVMKSGSTGRVLCWRPVMQSVIPALCPTHYEKAQKHVCQMMKKAGVNITSWNRPAPKFHVVIAEFVRQIQSKRREAKRSMMENNKIKCKGIS